MRVNLTILELYWDFNAKHLMNLRGRYFDCSQSASVSLYHYLCEALDHITSEQGCSFSIVFL